MSTIVTIPWGAFQDAFQANCVSGPFRDKAQWLVRTFGCFHERRDKGHEAHGHHGRRGGGGGHRSREERMPARAPVEKPKIGGRDLSTAAIAKKDFLSMMNKVSVGNVDAFCGRVCNIMRADCTDVYVDVTWDVLQRMYDAQELYLRIIRHMMQAMLPDEREVYLGAWRRKWQAYVEGCGWMPRPELLQEETYDDFCDLVKWKKRACAAVSAWMMLMKEGIIEEGQDAIWQHLSCAVNLAMDPLVPEVLDALLDQAKVFVSNTGAPVAVSMYEIVTQWKAKGAALPSASRFKIYDLWDALHAKVGTASAKHKYVPPTRRK